MGYSLIGSCLLPFVVEVNHVLGLENQLLPLPNGTKTLLPVEGRSRRESSAGFGKAGQSEHLLELLPAPGTRTTASRGRARRARGDN